jgi:molybdopterin-guanine dinucleotide biosynthesis protein A
MGRDKATLQLGDGTSLQHAVAALGTISSELIIAAGNRPVQNLDYDALWVPDPPGAVGPLAGLAAGLSAASHPVSIVVACDMPFLSPRLLRYLLNSADDCDAVVPMARGRAQPLHAVYSRNCLPTIRSLLRTGAPSMRDLLSRLRVKVVGESRCRELDPEDLSAFNMNTVDDFRIASSHWDRRQGRVAAA